MKDTCRNSPLHEDAIHESAWKHVTGRALFIDDMPRPASMLVAHIIASPVARGRIQKLGTDEALRVPGVAAILTAKDIPGINDVSAIYHDEELLASSEVHCVGQAIALILGETYEACHQAAKRVALEIETLPAILDIRDAIAQNSLHSGEHIIARGDLEEAFQRADFTIEGEVESPGQEHWYLETQCAQAEVNEDDDVVIYASSQNPREVQVKTAEILGLTENRVVVIMPRMGGGFGGKETQGAQYAGLAALGAWVTRRPVRVWLNRDEDMMYTGKRHPFFSTYRAAFANDGTILGLYVKTWANGGWAHDLSRSILDRCLFHLDGSYFIPALHFEGHIAKTNLPSNTAFRGFGGPQGFIVIETVMNRAARHLGMEPVDIRRLNFYGPSPRNVMQYGAELRDFRIPRMTEEILKTSNYLERKQQIDAFNAKNRFIKRGIGFMPVKFGISFTNAMLNQGGALVLIYADGSVAINHGGTEMGQGLHTKMIAIAAHDLGISPDRIRLMDTRTDKVPNTSPTAASSGTDLNGAAIHDACKQLARRLRLVAAQMLDIPENDADSILLDSGLCLAAHREPIAIEKVIKQAYFNRVQLSAAGFYATPGIGYDAVTGRGTPFAYYSYGVCVLEVECCSLTGEYQLCDVEVIHDVGDAILPCIDRGQVEGAFVQGYGWLSCEELVWGKDGSLKSHNPATYKIPTIGMIPEPDRFRIRLLSNATADAVHGSKAVGEPPFVLAVALMQALEHAIGAAGSDPKRDPQITWPATPESVLRAFVAQKAP
ncbi:MAG: xanthine dehydrogenase molybdopterin binding subunit [Proteobacteria bacterium]|nr:xanthine dehydrogenase molybdopterin binding subunit [Pseudomonadota bacterium]